MIIAFKRGRRTFFIYGFEKGERANISEKEQQALKIYGKTLLSWPDSEILKRIDEGELFEIEEVRSLEGKSIMEVVLESARDLKFDKVTMHELEALALPEVKPLTPKQIKSIRNKAKVSQNVMAKWLNVSPSTCQKWTMPIQNWSLTLSQLAIFFEGRLDKALKIC